jgi:hypothetical protein
MAYKHTALPHSDSTRNNAIADLGKNRASAVVTPRLDYGGQVGRKDKSASRRQLAVEEDVLK